MINNDYYNGIIIKSLEKPSLYTKTEGEFWNDEYISKQMLKAHLDPNFEGASRKIQFIESSVSWIAQLVPPSIYPRLIDIGCGPGIYAEKFTEFGYHVTGVDFSKRSIDYARESANNKKSSITYLYKNYLEMELNEVFDFAVMIYCDYGALSTSDRQLMMSKAYRNLRPGGKFLLDVFSMASYHTFRENQTWEISHEGGFWREDEYLAINGQYKYPLNVTLDQTLIVSDKEMEDYYLWTTYFTKIDLIQETKEAGFTVCGIFGDVAGGLYSDNNGTMAILLEK